MIFSEIIGQAKAVKLLSRSLAGNRLAHGYLFTGPDGVGKTTTARALAAGLFCTAPEDERPCGHCGGCVKFSSGNHPDFVTIVPDGAAIKIDQIRALKKALSFPPFEAGRRVVVIEDIQTMLRAAGNSLLKILEEPPPDNLLLLIASDSEPILPTIISRCQVIPFTPLTTEQAVAVIMQINPELAPAEARALALLADGCPGQAQTLQGEQVLPLRSECIAALVAGAGSEAETVEQALDLAGKLADCTEGLATVFDLLALFFKETMIGLLSTENPSGDSEAVAARERWNLQQLSDKIQAIDAARRQLARNCNRGLVCEVLLLELFAR